jgi:hypothetical protein
MGGCESPIAGSEMVTAVVGGLGVQWFLDYAYIDMRSLWTPDAESHVS